MHVQRVDKLEDRWSTEQLITGVELPEWIRILGQNDFKVSPEYLHRLAWITGWSLPSTLFGRIENALDDDYVATPTSPAGLPFGVFFGVDFTF